jgi:hypothetical protein
MPLCSKIFLMLLSVVEHFYQFYWFRKLLLYPGDSDLGPSLREICAANRSDEKQVLIIVMNWYLPAPSWFVWTLYWSNFSFLHDSKLKHFLKMLDLQCVQTTPIGLEMVILRLSLEMLINQLSLTFCKHILRIMLLRNCRLAYFISDFPKIVFLTVMDFLFI